VPPHFRGLPLIGSGAAFLRAPIVTIERAFRAKGPIFTISLGPKKLACLVGPALAGEFFGLPGDVLSVGLATRALRPVMGDIAFPDTKEDQRKLRDALGPLVTKQSMERYLPAMFDEAQLAISVLEPVGQLELVAFTERLSQSIAIRCFLGEAFARGTDESFREAFSDLIKSVDMFLPPNLPIPKFRRRDRARALIGGMIEKSVVERRERRDPLDDSLQWLSTLRGADGEYWSIPDTVDLVVSLLFGGHHTTGALMAWTIVHLLRNPEALTRVLAEIDGAGPEEFGYLSAAIRESERIEPPSGFIIRGARRDLNIGGYRIRKGWLVALCPPVAQRLPEVFDRPDEFDPERFVAGHSFPAHSLIGFGGGPHSCIGKAFAFQACRASVVTLLRNFHLELQGPPPLADPRSVLRRPRIPCLVEYGPRG